MGKTGEESHTRKLFRRIYIFLLVILTAAGFYWAYQREYVASLVDQGADFISARLFGSEFWISEPSNNSTVESPLTRISGHAPPFAEVKLSVNGIFVYSTRADWQGRFTFDKVRLDVGRNEVVVTFATGEGPFDFGGRTSLFLDYRKSPPSVPSVTDVQYNYPTDELIVTGIADPNVEVVLTINSETTAQSRTDTYGLFEVSVPLTATEQCTITAVARTFSEVESEVSTVVWEPQPTSIGVFSVLSPISRTVTLDLGFDQSSLDLEIIIPKNDRRVCDFLAGKIDAVPFLESTLGTLEINNRVVTSLLAWNKPEIEISDLVSLQWRFEDLGLEDFTLFGPRQILIETGDSVPAPRSEDMVVVTTGIYDVVALRPLPTSIDQDRFIWQQSLNPATPPIEIELELDKLKIPLLIPRLNPYRFVSYPFSILVSLAQVLVICLPVVWILLLLREEGAGAIESDDSTWLAKSMSRAVNGILTLCLIGPALYLIDAFAYLLQPGLFSLSESMEMLLFSIRDLIDYDIFPKIAAGLILVLVLVLLRLLLLGTISQLAKAVSAIASASIGATVIAVLVYVAIFLLSEFESQFRPLEKVFPMLVGVVLVVYTVNLADDASAGLLYHLRLRKTKPMFLFILFALPLLYPISVPIISSGEIPFTTRTQITTTILFESFRSIWLYIPLLALVALVAPLSQVKLQTEEGRRLANLLAVVVFAGYIVGTRSWMLIPIPFLLALYLSRYLLKPELELLKLNFVADKVHRNRKELIESSINWELAEEAEKAVDQLDAKLAEGTINPETYESSKIRLQEFIAKHKSWTVLPPGINPTKVAFAIGPNESAWQNGKLALRWGLILSLPLLIIYSVLFLGETTWSADPYFYLSIVIRLSVFYFKWLMQSFFFGYFFEYLRGENGLKKGLWLAFFVLICTLPLEILQLTSITEISSLVFNAAQKTLFFAALGTIAFDYRMLRQNGYSWRKLQLISDVPSLTTLASLILSAAGVAVTAVLTGRATDLVTMLLSLAIPEIPQLPR